MREYSQRPGKAERASERDRRYYRENAERVRRAVRAYREANLELVQERDRKRERRDTPYVKALARRLVRDAVASGQLAPEPCEKCGLDLDEKRFADGRRRVQAHHDDYSKPLDVRWLCTACHGVEHRRVA